MTNIITSRTQKIPLTRGFYSLVDKEDYERLSKYKWHVVSPKNNPRAGKRVKKGYIFLSREVLNAPKNKYVDHINGDTLDNRKSNLRLCSKSENGCNAGKKKNNTTGYKGVSFIPRNRHGNPMKTSSKRWFAQISKSYKHITIGYFHTKEEAARAYDEAAIKLHGEFAQLNFPGGTI